MISYPTRTVAVTTTPTNIRKTPAFENDPAAYPVAFANLRYASGGGAIEMIGGDPYARGTLTVESIPIATETIDVNGVTFTFVSGASTSTNVHIGATVEETAFNLMQVLGASGDADVDDAAYQNDFDSAVVNVKFKVPGTSGNAFTLADSSGSAVIASDTTLTGGLGYGDGQAVDAGSDFTDVDQSNERWAVASAGSINLDVTDFQA